MGKVIQQQNIEVSFDKEDIDCNLSLLKGMSMKSILLIKSVVEIENVFKIEFDYTDMEMEKIAIFENAVDSVEQMLDGKKM